MRRELSHLASRCGRGVDASKRKEHDSPDNHCPQAVATRRVREMMVSVRQCLMNKDICPSDWMTHQGSSPQPACDTGAYRIGRGV